jgi:ABC-type bacteriocin/lantibiotic exporter with double-glycine peptidase domain
MKNLKKIFSLLNSNEKKSFYYLLVLISITGLIDMLGVASILPFLALVINPDIVQTNEIYNYLYIKSAILGVGNSKQFLIFFGLIIFFFMMFSVIFRTYTNYKQVYFALMREYSIGKRLVEAYLKQPYIWFTTKNSAELGKNILSEINQVITFSMVPMLSFISQTIAVTAIIILLILINMKIAIIAGSVLISSYILIFYFVKNFLRNFGSERLRANKNRFASVQEVFSSIKNVKIKRLEKFYVNRFAKPAKIYAENQSFAAVVGLIPRHFIEGISFGAMIILVLVLIERGNNLEKIIPIIALYAFAGYRLLPGLQQIYNAFTQIRFSEHALDTLYNELKNLESLEKVSKNLFFTSTNKSITLNNVSFRYTNNKKMTLNNISLSIPFYSTVGIVGATGSGKTTLIDIILGLINPTEGTLSVDSDIINIKSKLTWGKIIGYVPQRINLIDSSIKNNIAFGVGKNDIDYQLVQECAKFSAIHEFIKKLPEGYNTNIGEAGAILSGGQIQRIGIARALYNKPKILILDEATNALDAITEKKVMESICKKLGNKITTIIVAHRINVLKNCNIIFYLEKGKLIAQGTYDELVKTNKIFKKISLINRSGIK